MQTTALLAGVENHRVGQVSGNGGLTKIVRTFHARFGSVKMGAGQTPRQRIAYVRREGQHAKDAGDVEATAGDKEKVLDTADRLEAGARIKRGPTADRLLATQVIELPAESTPEQRQACAEAFVNDWRKRGHQTIATVHVHGEERRQPHLHVEIAARPMGADGEVDRSVRLWRGKPTIYAERQRVADIVNRTCEPDPPYHPGGFRDIGREGDTPKKRIPARPFRDARKQIRAEPEKATEIEAKAYAVSDKERGEKRKAHVARTAEVVEFRAAGQWPRPSQRARADKAEASVATLTDEKQQAETRAGRAEASVAALEDEKRLAEARAEEVEAAAARPVDLTDPVDAEAKAGLEDVAERYQLGNIAAADDQLFGWYILQHEERARANAAEERARELEARQVQPLALSKEQHEMLVDVCGRKGIEGDPVHDARVQLLAFHKLHEERDKAREARKKAAEAEQAVGARAEETRREAERQRLAAEAAEAARQKALDPARKERAAELRKEFLVDQQRVRMHRQTLARPAARNVHGKERAALEAAEGRQKARRAEAAKLGIELEPRSKSGTGQPPRGTSRGD